MPLSNKSSANWHLRIVQFHPVLKLSEPLSQSQLEVPQRRFDLRALAAVVFKHGSAGRFSSFLTRALKERIMPEPLVLEVFSDFV
jgi:hypothetical protein